MRALRPVAVRFIVSEATDHVRSSSNQVESLRGEPDCPADVGTYSVPADDPDATFARCVEWMRGAQRLFPESRLVADYTGGTKSMTGGLLMAAMVSIGVKEK